MKYRLGHNASRLVQAVLVVLGATFLISLLLRLLPVGLEEVYVYAPDEATRDEIRRSLRLDKDPVTFYLMWLWDFVRGDFGYFVYQGGFGDAVIDRVATALPISLRIVLYVQVLALAVAIPLGIFTAYRVGRRSDRIISYGVFTAASIPNFVFGLVLALVFAVLIPVLPNLGYVPPGESVVEHVRTMILPVVSLSIPLIATYTRLLRTEVIATLREDYVTMAVSKGLSNRRVLFTHVFRPSSVTLFTSAALNTGALIGGALVIEGIFTIPGMGGEIAFALFSRQYFALQSYVALIAVGFVLFNTLVDIIVGYVDPRARERRNA